VAEGSSGARLRARAEILVLDEPTSALDPIAEWRVFEHIREMAQGKAVLLISHRFSTVRMADRVHIVEQGAIVESGTHAELLALNERYARMYDVQARSYRKGSDGPGEAGEAGEAAQPAGPSQLADPAGRQERGRPD
jgi:ABC-type multidrug transport system ATPase subunit